MMPPEQEFGTINGGTITIGADSVSVQVEVPSSRKVVSSRSDHKTIEKDRAARIQLEILGESLRPITLKVCIACG